MALYALGEQRVQLLGERHFIAPTAAVIGRVVLGNDSSVWFNAVIRGDNEPIHVGESTNIQDGAVLHVDPGFPMRLGRMVSVGHKAMLHGCTVDDGSLIGMNSVVMNGARIGAGSIIGANALVPEGKEIPAGVLAVGTPARVIRELRPEDKELLLQNAREYVLRSAYYRDNFRV
jgi:carbonic anhydrase/acetyltransferase-like protein (isoleucine patch superfamily)